MLPLIVMNVMPADKTTNYRSGRQERRQTRRRQKARRQSGPDQQGAQDDGARGGHRVARQSIAKCAAHLQPSFEMPAAVALTMLSD